MNSQATSPAQATSNRAAAQHVPGNVADYMKQPGMQAALHRLTKDVGHIPLGNIDQGRRRQERVAAEAAIRSALNANISEVAIYARIHDGKHGLPSEKIAVLAERKVVSSNPLSQAWHKVQIPLTNPNHGHRILQGSVANCTSPDHKTDGLTPALLERYYSADPVSDGSLLAHGWLHNEAADSLEFCRQLGGRDTPFVTFDLTVKQSESDGRWIPIHGSVSMPSQETSADAANLLMSYWRNLPLRDRLTHENYKALTASEASAPEVESVMQVPGKRSLADSLRSLSEANGSATLQAGLATLEDGTSLDLAEVSRELASLQNQHQLLADVLGKCIAASGMFRPDMSCSGPQLLKVGEDLAELLTNWASFVAE